MEMNEQERTRSGFKVALEVAKTKYPDRIDTQTVKICMVTASIQYSPVAGM